ncbi:MAG TPA: AAA family ATPase [Acidimicrobiales bacterium]|nr:AAA family ATPase [Acidimicrobiales bacterium]
MEGKGGVLGTVSVLFTDLVGSTEQRVRLGEDAADALRRVHDELVGAAVVGSGGTVVKRLGDGVMATFPAAADAVAAAVAIQQAIARHGAAVTDPGRRLAVRIGLSTGDVMVEGDDVHGTPVVEAARLCASALGGEILAAELVRMLARSRGVATFEPIGDVELKGLPEPVATCRVLWEPEADAGGARPPLPPLLVGTPATGYVGRDGLRATLADAWRGVAAGGCRAVLLAGEPGVGKTRTAAELARLAYDEGAVVLYGRCDEDLGAPYQPFVEALTAYAMDAPPDGVHLGRLPGELTRLVPELSEMVTGVGAPVASDPRSEEYRLFEATASWLVDAGRASGLVLVVDDLHWAARPTLQLLLHALRAASAERDARVLVVGTYRDTDIDRSHPLSDVLAELRRLPLVSRLSVDGLTEDEVVAFAEVAAGHELDDTIRALARTVHAETDGNAFFVGEVLRHLVEVGAVRRDGDRWVVAAGAVDVPEGVRDVVGRRVSRLSTDANTVLSVAAVVGREGDLDVVAEVVDLPEGAVLDAFDEGVRARLLEESDVDRYRFAHALVRTTLYDELSATRRRRLHRRIAETLEKLHRDDVVALAYHSLQAGPDGGDATRAARYSMAAGDQALAQRALADAEVRYRTALELVDDSGIVDEDVRLRAMCGLGEALRDQARPEYRETLLRAARDARTAGLTDLLVRAVLSNDRGYASMIGRVDDERVEMIEAALAAVGDAPTAERIRLVALLSQELFFGPQRDRARRLGAEAEALARDVDDDRLRCEVVIRCGLSRIHQIPFPEYLVRIEEGAAIAERLGDPALRVVTGLFLSSARLTVGDVDGGRAADAANVAGASDGSPSLVWTARSHAMKWAVACDPIPVSTAANDECRDMGERAGEPDHLNWWAATFGAIDMMRAGDVAALADVAGAYAAEYPGAPTWRMLQALALADAGRVDECDALISRHGLDPRRLIDEPFPFVAAAGWARLAHRLRRPDMARDAAELLTPHSGLWTHFFLATWGPVDYDLALCASLLGEHDRAVELATGALAIVADAGMVTLRDHLSLGVADVLRGAGHGDRARTLLREVVDSTAVTGADGVRARALAMLGEV